MPLASRALYSYPCPTQFCDGCSAASMALTARHDKWLCPGCRAKVPAHPKEMDAREKLAAKIAQRLSNCLFTPDDFAQLSESMWASFGITFKADKKTISPECRVMIAEMLNRLAEIAEVERA